MSRACDLFVSKKVAVGNNVSHSNRKTKRRFLPNLQNVTLKSDALNQNISFRVAARSLRTVMFKGGLDNFLLNTSNNKLTEKAQKVKRALKRKLAAQDQAA